MTGPVHGLGRPAGWRVPMAFRAGRATQTLTPFIHVLAGVTPLPFDLKNDNGDTTLIYIIPNPTGCSGWPVATEITIFADQGLPDAFGKPLAMPVAGRFVTSSIGGCGGTDGGTSDAAMADAGADAANTDDGGRTDGGATDDSATDGSSDNGGDPSDALSVELTREHFRERVAHSLLHGRHVDGPPELARHRAHHGRVQPTGVDGGEAPGDRSRRSARTRGTSPSVHATPIEPACARRGVPHAGPPGLARRRRPKPASVSDERLLEVAQVDVQVALVLAQQEDRVADELAGAVVRDVAAALDLESGVSPRSSRLSRFALRPAREHVRVLDEQQRVGDLAGLALLDERELARPDGGVVARPEIEDRRARRLLRQRL